jgi:Ca2+/Na+ antiporter
MSAADQSGTARDVGSTATPAAARYADTAGAITPLSVSTVPICVVILWSMRVFFVPANAAQRYALTMKWILYAITVFILMLLSFQLQRWWDSGNSLMLWLFFLALVWIGWRWTDPEDKEKISAPLKADLARLRDWLRRALRL